MKTILFGCSYEPYKAVISVPSMVSGFSIEDIRKATDKPLPNLSQGYFTIISRSNNCQVALFKYKVAAGFRIAESPHHLKLPLPNSLHKNIKKLTKEPNIRVVFLYVYRHDQPNTVQSGTVVLDEPTLPIRKTSGTEFSRTAIMVGLLLSKFGNLLDIETSEDNSRFCPFTRGGDILIQRKNATSAAVIHERTPEDDGSTPFSVATYDVTTSKATAPTTPQATAHLNITPPKVGELRCSAAENKMTQAQSDEVTWQLQANMMLLTSRLLRTKVEENPGDADSINLLTCYGLQLGSMYPLKIIKLTINFEACKCEYEEQFILYSTIHLKISSGFN